MIKTPTDFISKQILFYKLVKDREGQDVECLKKHVSLIINVFSTHDILFIKFQAICSNIDQSDCIFKMHYSYRPHMHFHLEL